MKKFLLLSAMLGFMAAGMSSAMSQEVLPKEEVAGCRWFCQHDNLFYKTIDQCAAACGGSFYCEQIC